MRMDPEEVSIMWNLGSKVQRRGSWNQGLRSKARMYIRVTLPPLICLKTTEMGQKRETEDGKKVENR
jgi:hypothetical protein